MLSSGDDGVPVRGKRGGGEVKKCVSQDRKGQLW